MASHSEQIYNSIMGNAPVDGSMYTEAQLEEAVSRFRIIFSVSDEEAEAVLKRLQVQLSIRMDSGAVVVDSDYRPWLKSRQASIDPFFWERYRKYLLIHDKWSPTVLNTLDRVADEILDLAGDPDQIAGFSRKGLVVGDVQSGKTATYTAIACKAADAGYRLIILLTGTIESLRRQTQIRLDEGFIGRDSSQLLQKNQVVGKSLVGVGNLDGRKIATAFTSRRQDFSKVVATQLGFSVANSSLPILLVCKKNAKILENLRSWLEAMSAQHGRIDVPLLLIDDEADSASINTSSERESATRTNQEIRQLLKLFDKSTYIGVTATPFANVFIQPDNATEMLGDDLFPSSFIYALEPPSNYIGPEKIFSDGLLGFLKSCDDAEPSIPIKHGIDHRIVELPTSLRYAINCFIIATTIRDLRDEGATHRSMLVNVSRFTAVQESVRACIDDEVRAIQREIRTYANRSVAEAFRESSVMSALHNVWLAEFEQAGFSWVDIASRLNVAVSPITVVAVNQRSGSSGLDYQAHKQTGLRVIAVGGNSLSRGLTLEGLSTSYFYRSSIMYDTLLQMGRWFGYRFNYDDLCRLFLTREAESWFSYITEATIDLRDQLRRMQKFGQTPKEFGLKVRAHPDSLIVTARNKMRSSHDFQHFISLSGQSLETYRLLRNPIVCQSNYAVAERFIESMAIYPRIESKHGWFTYGPVPRSAIADFLLEFTADPTNFRLQTEAIAGFFSSANIVSVNKLNEWDVTLVSLGKPDPEAGFANFAGLDVGVGRRNILLSTETPSILISGTKARVGSVGSESEGFSPSELALITAENGGNDLTDKELRLKRKRPLLFVYLIRGFQGYKENARPYRPDDKPLVALGLSFPAFDDSLIATNVAYKVNVVEWNSLFADVETDDEADEE